MAELNDDLDQYPIAESTELVGQVPVIDVGEIVLDSASPAARDAVGQIATACREWGFFQVVNHGIPQALIDATWRETAAFFTGPQSAKDAIMRTRENPWGYYNNELTKNQRDKKEVFDYTTDGVDPIYRSENRWPAVDGAFRSTLRDYRDAVTELSLALLEAFCVGLDLPPGPLVPLGVLAGITVVGAHEERVGFGIGARHQLPAHPVHPGSAPRRPPGDADLRSAQR